MIVFGYAIGYVVIARIVVLKKLKNREEGRESIKKEERVLRRKTAAGKI